MTDSLEDIVERAVDNVIRAFRPDNPGSFEGCDSELQRVEALLSSAGPGSNVPDLIAQIRALRIFLAAEFGDAEASVVRQSEDFLKTCPPTRLDFFNVQTLRLRALHALHRHSDELREALEAAKSPDVRGENFVLLIEGLAKRHPGSLGGEAFLQEGMSDALKQLSLAGYTNLPTTDQVNINLEQAALETAAELRRVNNERSKAVLAEHDRTFR